MKVTIKLIGGLALLLGLLALTVVLIVITRGAAAVAEVPVAAPVVSDAIAENVGQAYAEGVVDIVLGDMISIDGEGATVDGNSVKITAAGVYSLRGTLSDGHVEVDARGKVYLELNGVDITSSLGPALMIVDAKKVTLTLVDGTTNTLADAWSGDDNNAALFTNDTLVINGKGTLVVNGNDNEGISGDDDIIINAGTIRVTAVDDALNAHDDITVNGGDVYLLAGGDGLDSNGTVHVSGGTLVSMGGTASGDCGIDARADFVITGGKVIAAGSSVARPGSDSSQCSLVVSAGSVQAAGTEVAVTRDGREILTFTLVQGFQSVLVSSDELIAGAGYQVRLGPSGTTISGTAGR